MHRVRGFERPDLETDIAQNLGQDGGFADERHLRRLWIGDANRARLIGPCAGDDRGDVSTQLLANVRRLGTVVAQATVELRQLRGVVAASAVGGVEPGVAQVFATSLNNCLQLASKPTESLSLGNVVDLMIDDPKGLVRAAFSLLSEKSTLDDLDKVGSIAKAAAEVDKAETDSKNARGTFWREVGAVFSSVAVPVAALATVVVTIWIQSNQASLSRQQLEDTQWREFLESISKSQNNAISDVTFVPRLKTFLHSNVYHDQVDDIAKRLLGRLTDKVSFDDLFNIAFPAGNTRRLSDMKDILKALQRTDIIIQITCNPTDQAFLSLQIPAGLAPWGLCATDITEQEALNYLKTYPSKDKIIQAKRDSNATADEENIVTNEILRIVRNISVENNGMEIDLSGLHFSGGDCSAIDFSRMDLTDALFASCDFTKSILTPVRYQNIDLDSSN